MPCSRRQRHPRTPPPGREVEDPPVADPGRAAGRRRPVGGSRACSLPPMSLGAAERGRRRGVRRPVTRNEPRLVTIRYRFVTLGRPMSVSAVSTEAEEQAGVAVAARAGGGDRARSNAVVAVPELLGRHLAGCDGGSHHVPVSIALDLAGGASAEHVVALGMLAAAAGALRLHRIGREHRWAARSAGAIVLAQPGLHAAAMAWDRWSADLQGRAHGGAARAARRLRRDRRRADSSRGGRGRGPAGLCRSPPMGPAPWSDRTRCPTARPRAGRAPGSRHGPSVSCLGWRMRCDGVRREPSPPDPTTRRTSTAAHGRRAPCDVGDRRLLAAPMLPTPR